MTKGADLYRLQRLDSEKDAKQRRLKEIAAALGESKTLRQAQQALDSAKKLTRKWAVRQQDLELELQGVADKITRSEQRLYSGAVKNPKELADLQAKVATLQRRWQKLEDDLLEAMIERENADTTHVQAQEHFDETKNRQEVRQTDLLAEQETLEKELAEIDQAQASLLPSIEQGDLATYQNLRRSKGGLAVVQIQNSTCGGCRVTISPNREWKLRQGELVCCGNCERIIVRA